MKSVCVLESSRFFETDIQILKFRIGTVKDSFMGEGGGFNRVVVYGYYI